MASLLDISLLEHFSDVFVLLFIFTAVYAILMFKQPFGNQKGLNAMMAFAISMVFIFSKDAIAIIKDTVPWFVLMMIVLMMVLLGTKSFGAELLPSLTKNMSVWLFVIGIIILLINIGGRYGQQAGPFLSNSSVDPDNVVAGGSGDVGSGDYSQNFGATIFHPKVLAMIMFLLIALFATFLVGYTGVA
jgi:hypothetical protein